MNEGNEFMNTPANGDGVRDGRAVVRKVFDAEPADDTTPARVAGGTGCARAGVRAAVAALLTLVCSWVRRVWSAPGVLRVRSVAGYRARKAPMDALRLVWFVTRGHGRWIGKAWTWVTYGDLRADARAARLAGNQEARRAAQEALRADARARWARLGMVAHRTAPAAPPSRWAGWRWCWCSWTR